MQDRDEVLKAVKRYQQLYLKLAGPVRDVWSISQTEFDVIAFLSNHPGCNTAKDVCEMRMLKKSNVSVAIDNLTRRGLVACSVDRQDRRVNRLQFLPEAEPLRKEIRRVQNEFGRILFDGIPRDEIESYLDVLRKTSEHAESAMKEKEE